MGQETGFAVSDLIPQLAIAARNQQQLSRDPDVSEIASNLKMPWLSSPGRDGTLSYALAAGHACFGDFRDRLCLLARG
jgi:hypothetical protein